jgi:hypothetical protein
MVYRFDDRDMYKSLVLLFATLPLSLAAINNTHAAGNLSGTYDVGTLTPLQRPEAYGNNLFLTEEQAAEYARRMAARVAQDAADSDPNRKAPEKGGNVGGYNFFWLDVGTDAASVDGKFRTSIITTPANGRIPAMTQYGAARLKGFLDNWQIIWRDPDPTTGKNSGVAWWLDGDNGPYDNLEQRPLAERCIIGSRSTAGPPMLPNIYNNHKRIIQTPDHIMILTEMNHDARVIRMNATHRPDNIRTWLGDSIGRWEGETLVIETKNFKQTPALSGADENLQVTEYLRHTDDGGLLYRFEINNPEIWTEPWAGEYPWAPADGKVYEVACHEGNYALGNIMRGARVLEADAKINPSEPAG